eukprot:gb/GECG01000422.1/.p1 GENE.gb/GECG01000422.1/~~gb/GECG01000422.1/.p1  ORF type:complete len:434 (+),score=39.22 gb/GECG01000422.1/:1-1302(+)
MSHKRVAPSPHAHLRETSAPLAKGAASGGSGRERITSRASSHTVSSSRSGAHKNGGASLSGAASSSRFPHKHLFEGGEMPSGGKQQRLMARVHHQLIIFQEIVATLDRTEQLMNPTLSTAPVDAAATFAPTRRWTSSSDPMHNQDNKAKQVNWGLLTRDRVDQYYRGHLYTESRGTTEESAIKSQHFTRVRFYCYLCLAMGLTGPLSTEHHKALVQGCLRLFKEYKHLQLSFDLKTRDLRRLGRKNLDAVNLKSWLRIRMNPSPVQLQPSSFSALSVNTQSVYPAIGRTLSVSLLHAGEENSPVLPQPEQSLIQTDSQENDGVSTDKSLDFSGEASLSTSEMPPNMSYKYLRIPSMPLSPWDSGFFRVSPSQCLNFLLRPFIQLFKRLLHDVSSGTLTETGTKHNEELCRLVNKYILEPFLVEFAEMSRMSTK